VMTRSSRVPLLLATLCLLAACSDNNPAAPVARCSSGAQPTTLTSGQAGTFAAADLATCLDLPGDGATYVIVPQLAAPATSLTPVSYELGEGGATGNLVAGITPDWNPVQSSRSMPGPLQDRFDHSLLVRNRQLAHVTAVAGSARSGVHTALHASVAPPAPGSTRAFFVCGNLDCTDSLFKSDTAQLEYVGANILFYQSSKAPPPPAGLTGAQLTALGTLIDQTLYGIDIRTFGQPSDIDANGRVIVLMSPYVNAISPASECASQGFVAGFFFGPDLIPSVPHSNAAEIYYSLAPDPNGTFSCPHTVGEVEQLTGATFLHEMLHMINFNQKVLVHHDNDTEVEFLDEGMAKIAEEFGARYYEQRYPPPTGRTNPAQLFPDSAEGFITGDLFNSYDYLANPGASTATLSTGASTLPDAGAEWLFLRWLGDQTDSTIYARIVQSALTGMPNLEAAAGASFPQLFGEFSMALYTDSLPGVMRGEPPAPYRFESRNLRQLYQALFRAVADPTVIPRPFPIELTVLSPGTSASGALLPGTMHFYKFTTPTNGATGQLHFSSAGGAAFDATSAAQVTVFRCPTADACP